MTTVVEEFKLVVMNSQGDTNRRIVELLATLGHEIRNPLSALSYALEVWPGAQHDQVQMEELRSLMQRQVRQLKCLTDNLLDVGRSNSREGLKLCRKHVPLRQLIDDACEEVRPFIDRCGHTLTVTQPDEPIMVDGDPSRLLQVFANLIQNAAKFTGCNGSLCIDLEPLNGMACVRVCDNGPGIEEHKLSEIFEGFAQSNGGRGSENEGLGIGLPLVKAIVELHGGSVSVHSSGPGRGSEFTVLLPMLNEMVRGHWPTTQSVAAVNELVERPPTCRIVVVDDDRSNGELLTLLLRTIGQSVTVASNGEMAVRMVLAERPQVVFLDLIMEGMGGCEVARELRDHPELEGLILIALSGNGDQESHRRAREAGFDRYLVKPISVAVLTETLNSLSPSIFDANMAGREPVEAGIAASVGRTEIGDGD